MNILLVDDCTTIREIVAKRLKRDGHTVLEAEDGYKGYCKWICFRDIDLVITDQQMPVWDGYDLAREIRKISSVPILLHTAATQPKRIPEINDIIVKGDIAAINKWITNIDVVRGIHLNAQLKGN